MILMFAPMLGTFFPPETYFRTGYGEESSFGFPVTPICLVLISATIIFLYLRMRVEGRTIHHTPAIYIFVLYVFCSLAWNPEPQVAFLRILRLLPAIGLGIVLPQWLGLYRFFRLMTIAIILSAICSIGVSVLVPSLGMSTFGNGYEN
ncbi:MAG: hypothetical protein QM690_19510, partial [Sphingobium sp.]